MAGVRGDSRRHREVSRREQGGVVEQVVQQVALQVTGQERRRRVRAHRHILSGAAVSC
jgi:hypothetical protein